MLEQLHSGQVDNSTIKFTLLLLKGCPENMDGRLLWQVDGACFLEDVPHSLRAVALQVLGILQK